MTTEKIVCHNNPDEKKKASFSPDPKGLNFSSGRDGQGAVDGSIDDFNGYE